jgi:DNA-binding NtrC family response regulator
MPDPDTILWRPKADARDAAVRHFVLEIVDSETSGRSFENTAPRCSIGSHARNDLVIEDPTVSRFHCEVHVEASGARVRDLDSRNGTIVDGVSVREAYLRAGSVLTLGRVALRFRPADRSTPLPVSNRTELAGLVGRSVAMRSCFALLERAAAKDVTVLVEGETGTGKSKAARALHQLSARASGPFLTVDCGAIPASLLESELFGHRKGAFTGAVEDRIGVFEGAQGGSVFLDEIGELPLDLQPKLLKAIEDREVRRLGTNAYRPIDVRVIAASNRDLRSEVNAGRFRADLFYRLAVVRVTIPPLRRRPEDIELITEKLLESFGAEPEASATLRTPEFIARLEAASWPGNVRELRNHLERCLVFEDALQPSAEHDDTPPPPIDAHIPYGEARRRAIAEFERGYIASLLALHGGNVQRAADAAELDRAYVYKLLRRHRDP